jgi:hypothetical protein
MSGWHDEESGGNGSDRQFHYFDYGGGFIGVYTCQNLFHCILCVCN